MSLSHSLSMAFVRRLACFAVMLLCVSATASAQTKRAANSGKLTLNGGRTYLNSTISAYKTISSTGTVSYLGTLYINGYRDVNQMLSLYAKICDVAFVPQIVDGVSYRTAVIKGAPMTFTDTSVYPYKRYVVYAEATIYVPSAITTSTTAGLVSLDLRDYYTDALRLSIPAIPLASGWSYVNP